MPPPSFFPGPGEKVGPYRLVRQLGQGGMGVVFEADDPGLARRVAVKIISIHLADDPEFRARFTREAQAQASLDSAHVVRVYSHGEADGRLYIATQLVPDGDLGAMLRGHGAAPPWLALDLVAQIASGLADAHDAGLIHRDLKPANVLLRRRGKAYNGYLTDFGIARHVDPAKASGLTKSGAAVGTPSYMAPELHTGGEAGIASDVYSIGCLLWATLTGGPPYPGRTEFEVINNHVTGPVPRLRDDGPVARELGELLARLLAKDPADRPASAESVAEQLREVAGRAPESLTAADRADPTPVPASWSPAPGRSTPAASSSPSTPSPSPPLADLPPPLPPGAMPHPTPIPPPGGPARSSRRPVLLAVVGLVLLVVVGVGVAWLVTRGDDDGSPSGGGTTTSASPDRPTSSYYDDLSDEEAVVAQNIADVLVSQEGTDRDAAECVSARTVRDRGVDSLQDDGLVRDDLTVDTEAPGSAGFFVTTALAAISCALEGGSPSS